MRGIRINASTIDPFKVNVAIIQLRLRVRILPVDSKVESSNMACLPSCSIQPRRLGGERGCGERKKARPLCARLARGANSRPSTPATMTLARNPDSPFIPFGTTVLV